MIAVDTARGMHVGELRRLDNDPVARRQVELRDAGTDIVLGVLEGDEMEPIADWPVDREIRRRMAAVADDHLRSLARRLAGVAGVDLEPHLTRPRSPDLAGAWSAAALPHHPFGYAGARDVATSVTYAAPQRLLREHGVTWCAAWETNHVAGASYHSLLEQLLRRILVQRLEPIAAAIREQLDPLSDMTPAPGQQEHMPLHALHAAMEPAVAASIDPIAQRLIGDFDFDTRTMTRPVRDELLAIYYSAGPVVVDIPHASREAIGGAS